MYTGAKDASERGKRNGEGVWRPEKESRKCEACKGVMGQEVTVPLAMQEAMFSDHCLIELPLI